MTTKYLNRRFRILTREDNGIGPTVIRVIRLHGSQWAMVQDEPQTGRVEPRQRRMRLSTIDKYWRPVRGER